MAQQDNNIDRDFQLSRYLDGDLDAAELDDLQRRLRDDADLRRTLEQYRALQQRLEDAPQADLAAQRGEIMASLERRALLGAQRRPRILRLSLAGLAAAAAIAVAATVGLRLFEGTPPAGPIRMIDAPGAVATLERALSPKAAVSVELRQARDADTQALTPEKTPSTVIVSVGRDERPETPYRSLLGADMDF
jgi:anti-sigma factor RsiW